MGVNEALTMCMVRVLVKMLLVIVVVIFKLVLVSNWCYLLGRVFSKLVREHATICGVVGRMDGTGLGVIYQLVAALVPVWVVSVVVLL